MVNAAGHIDMTLTEKARCCAASTVNMTWNCARRCSPARSTSSTPTDWPLCSLHWYTRPDAGETANRGTTRAASPGSIAIASSKLKGICEDIDILCEDHGLDEMQRPDFGILDIMYEWADGGSLGSCLYGTDMTGGDFVRTAKRLADVLQQIAVAQPLPFDGGERLAGLAHEAADRVNRGVVAYSGVD